MLTLEELADEYPLIKEMLDPPPAEELAKILPEIEKWALIFEEFSAKGKKDEWRHNMDAPASFVGESQLFTELIAVICTDDVMKSENLLESYDADTKTKIIAISSACAAYLMGVAHARNITEPR